MKNKLLYKTPLLLIPLYYILYFFINKIPLITGDAIGFRKSKVNPIVFSFTRYQKWSSRFWIEGATNLTSKNVILFSLITVLLMILFFYSVTNILKFNDYKSNTIFSVLFIVFFPYNMFSSAGWIATIVNCFWPFTLFAVWFVGFEKSKSNRASTIMQVFYIICLLLAIFNETLALFTFLIFFFSFIFIKDIKINVFNITSFILSILGILNVLLCPGNSVRKSAEITRWFPQFTDYSLFSRMTIQITHIFIDLTSGTGLLQLLLVCITLSLVRHNRILASLASIEIIFIELIKNKISLRLQNVTSVMQSGAVTAHLVSKLILPTLLSLLIFASLLYFITVIFKDKIRYRKILIILIAAGIIGISGSLTPTMIASADRPFFILKFVIAFYCILIIKDTLLTKESVSTIN